MSAIAAVERSATATSAKPAAVTGGLLMVVLSMVIPMPPGFLDVGIALSIATATLILVMACLVNKPSDFQAFPVLLLISLLMRLSLNVSSTRLILTEGHTGPHAAGQVINGFSSFVAGGSLMVGLTVFAVISVVNFMVITKGSGRMAEVSARFALDSLPGKQLAIDGDLNSGAIDHQEAQRRRVQEGREITFFGSLDGASKFVKGDAIAGLVITAINLFVGLAVGVLGHGVPVGEAIQTYSQLTIGDGLVSQIPALITSMAAALLLSRGGATDTTAEMLARPMGDGWHAPAVVAGGMAILAMVPGMPAPIFLAIAAGSGTLAYRNSRKPVASDTDTPALVEEAVAPTRIGDVLDTDEISVEIGADLIRSALDPTRGLGPRIANLRLHIAKTYGVILPEVRITDGVDLGAGDYVIRVQGVVRARGTLRAEQVIALGPPEVLNDVQGDPTQEPVYGSPARWVLNQHQDDAALTGATVVTPMEVVSTHLMETAKANLSSLFTLGSLQRLMQEMRGLSDHTRAESYQKLFDNLIPEKVSPELLMQVLRLLLDDGVSIRNLPLILEAVHEARSQDPEIACDMVRRRLRGQITEALSGPDGALSVVQLNPAWEAEMVRAENEAGRAGGSVAPMLTRNLTERLRGVAASLPPDSRPVLIVPDHRRRLMRAILQSAVLNWPVLGLDEVDPRATLHIIATVER